MITIILCVLIPLIGATLTGSILWLANREPQQAPAPTRTQTPAPTPATASVETTHHNNDHHEVTPWQRLAWIACGPLYWWNDPSHVYQKAVTERLTVALVGWGIVALLLFIIPKSIGNMIGEEQIRVARNAQTDYLRATNPKASTWTFKATENGREITSSPSARFEIFTTQEVKFSYPLESGGKRATFTMTTGQPEGRWSDDEGHSGWWTMNSLPSEGWSGEIRQISGRLGNGSNGDLTNGIASFVITRNQ